MTARSPLLLLAVLMLLGGCVDGSNDFDGDGVDDALDCAPADPAVFPTAPDPVDPAGLDSNCDGLDGVDNDRDGFASAASGGDDCNDSDASINPDGTEVAGNGDDEDCDGIALPCDQDGDGVFDCSDCAVDDPAQHTLDVDGDGFNTCRPTPETPYDCADLDPTVHPDAGDGYGDGGTRTATARTAWTPTATVASAVTGQGWGWTGGGLHIFLGTTLAALPSPW